MHDQWLQWLNSQAKSRKLNRNQIPLLVDQLPKNAPEIIQRFLEEGDPGSDFDLLLFGKRPPDVDAIYIDDHTGQSVDILDSTAIMEFVENDD